MPITPAQPEPPAAAPPAVPSETPPAAPAPSALFLWITAPISVVLSWVVAGISRSSGLWVFAILLSGLIACLALYRTGRRRPLFWHYRLLLLAALAVLGFEAVLRVAPGLLRGQIANMSYGAYHHRVGGIYRLEPHLGLELKPGYSGNIYWNGYWWHHRSNAAGCRGPESDQADVVFLGDSLIYGHGVQEADTVSAQFAALTGRPAANLGQQATCPIQMGIRFRRIGEALRPRLVVLCWHPNDNDDAVHYYGIGELRRIVAAPVIGDEPMALPEFEPPPLRDIKSLWANYLACPLRASGPAGLLWSYAKKGSWEHAGPVDEIAARPYVPPAHARVVPFPPERPGAAESEVLGWAANRHAVAEIAERCRRMGATLVVTDLGYPTAFSQAVERATREMGLAYIPAGRIALARADAGDDVYLAGDGHWSAGGHRIIAEELARHPAVRAALGLESK